MVAPLTISLVGNGKMAQSVARELEKLDLKYQQFDSKNLVSLEKLKNSKIVIDCSVGTAFLDNLESYILQKQDIIVVATGWYENMKLVKDKIQKSKNTLIWGDNFSIGMLIYKQILAYSCQLFSEYDYDLFGIEHHHRLKKDAPAGTTKKISELLLQNYPSKTEVSFENQHSQIDPKTLHIACLRGGDDNINHKFYFDNSEDCVEISHTAKDRIAFSGGVIKALQKLDQIPRGFYSFEEILKIKNPTS